MPDHYYTEQPSAKHDRRQFTETLRGKRLTFETDAGVFSKHGVDFGSRLLIEAMDIPCDARVLDIGCGYGPMGLTAASLATEGEVTLVDINERAVELARSNAARNQLHNVVIRQSDLFEEIEYSEFDVILSNPPIRAGKAVVHRIFEQAPGHLRQGGRLWVVIQKKQGAPSALQKLRSLFLQVDEITKDKGYRIYCSEKGTVTKNFVD